MDKDLNRKVAELAECGCAIGSDLNEGARLAVDATGCHAVSVYAINGYGQRFELRAHSGRALAEGPVTEVEFAPELEKLLDSGGVLPEGLLGRLALSAADESFSIIYPLGSKESLKGFLLLWGAAGTLKEDILKDETRVLVAVIGAAICAAMKWHDVAKQNEQLRSEVGELQGRIKSIEKFLYLGDMAAMLAHEIKNPLVSIGGFAERLKRKMDPDSPANTYVDLMISEIERIEKIADGAFRCTGGEHMEVERQDIKGILSETLSLFGDEFERLGIEVLTELENGPLTVMADREQLKIAFDNLIANAIQSMEQGGTLAISARRDPEGVEDMLIEITDSGKGIKEGDIDSIFTPFFTTKNSGTGLGLPISNSIIAHHQGVIEVVSNGETGTTFRVRLKCCES